jgi:hypothetical protein
LASFSLEAREFVFQIGDRPRAGHVLIMTSIYDRVDTPVTVGRNVRFCRRRWNS